MAQAERLQGLPGWRWRGAISESVQRSRNQYIWEAQYLALQAFLRENEGRYPANAAQPSERSLYRVRPYTP